jgi:excisionase family DNA binding protein
LTVDKLAVNVETAAEMASVPERTIWDAIAPGGGLRSFKLGKRRLIRVADLDAFLERRALLSSGAPAGTRSLSTRQPKPANGGPVVPFPQYETGGQTTKAAPSAAKRSHRAAVKGRAPTRANESRL